MAQKFPVSSSKINLNDHEQLTLCYSRSAGYILGHRVLRLQCKQHYPYITGYCRCGHSSEDYQRKRCCVKHITFFQPFKKQKNMNDTMKSLIAFTGGILVGSALGILFAPEKGTETRKKILSKSKDLADDVTEAAKEKFNDLIKKKKVLVDEAEEAISDIASKRHHA